MSRAQFQSLSTSKKILYLFRHYTWHLITAVVLICLFSAWIWSDLIVGRPDLSIEMINAQNENPTEGSCQSFLDEHNCPQKTVRISTVCQFDTPAEHGGCDPEQIMMCSVFSGRTDLYFWDILGLEDGSLGKGLVDLRDVLSPELLAQYQEDLIYTAPLLDGGYPCGIYLKDNAWIEENQFYTNCSDCAVGISKSAQDMDFTVAFLNYILK